MADERNVHPDRLRDYVIGVCTSLGSDPAEAGLVADQLVDANLAGHDSHGVGMVPFYVDAVKAGRLFCNRHATVASDRGAVMVIDGNRAFGQVAGFEATTMAIERAASTGVALVGLRDSFHIGRIGHWGEQCARAGMVSIHFVNVAGHAPSVAPHGGADGRFVTNPVCIAIPSRGDTPAALLDMATSVVAMGKVRVSRNKGEQVRQGALLDQDGKATTDPEVMFDDTTGALVAFGEHKGSGLAMMCEILGAALLGGQTIAPHHERDGAALNSMLSFVIDPDALGGRDTLINEAEAFLQYVQASRPRDGFDEVLLPGEPEQRSRAARAAGVPVDGATLAELRVAGMTAGLAEADLAALLD